MTFAKKLAFTTSGLGLLSTMGAAPATAAIFNFSYIGAGDTITPPGADATVSGVLTTGPYNQATNSYQITGITGTRNGAKIDSLLPSNSLLANDNILTVSSPQLDENGFAYTAGGQSYNVFHSYDYFEIAGNLSGGQLSSFTTIDAPSTPISVPEPSSVLGILSMSVLIGGTLLKQKLKQKKPIRSSL